MLSTRLIGAQAIALARNSLKIVDFFSHLVRCPTSYERAQNTRLHR